MNANRYGLTGEKSGSVELPAAFEAPVDKTLIKRAVLAIRSAKRQPYGASPIAGRDNTAVYVGARKYPTQMRTINTGRARLPRLKNRRALLYGQVAGVSQAVGGPAAHPPKSEKRQTEKINLKEKRKATQSAIAATADITLVQKRGHRVGENTALPIVVEDKFEGLDKTKSVRDTLAALSVLADVMRAKSQKKKRAGAGKRRGRKYTRAKSVLLVVSADAKKIVKAARNIEGVDVVRAGDLNAEVLAPGGQPGRLTVYTEKALKEIR